MTSQKPSYDLFKKKQKKMREMALDPMTEFKVLSLTYQCFISLYKAF